MRVRKWHNERRRLRFKVPHLDVSDHEVLLRREDVVLKRWARLRTAMPQIFIQPQSKPPATQRTTFCATLFPVFTFMYTWKTAVAVKFRTIWNNFQKRNTHTHPFNGPFFRDYLSGPVTERQNQSGFHWSKRQWVAVASPGPYASLHLAPDR